MDSPTSLRPFSVGEWLELLLLALVCFLLTAGVLYWQSTRPDLDDYPLPFRNPLPRLPSVQVVDLTATCFCPKGPTPAGIPGGTAPWIDKNPVLWYASPVRAKRTSGSTLLEEKL